MGIFKDLRAIKVQSQVLSANTDPGARLREMNGKVRSLNESMVQTTAALTAPGDVIAGHVSIVSVAPASASVGGDPALVVSVLVLRPGLPPVPTTTTVIVPVVQVHRVQPGAVIPAQVRTTAPADFAIDWAAPSP